MRQPRPQLALALAVAALGSPIRGQVTWTNREVFGRVTAPVAFDLLRDRLVVLTNAPGTFLGPMDTWEWNGTQWLRQRPANPPPARSGHAMTYDVRRARVVVFGGNTASAETWEWDGVDWANRLPANSPPTRTDHAMTYDLVQSRTILFGGVQSTFFTTFLGDTWTWDGTTWTQVQGAAPPARSGHGLAFHFTANHAVLFGGRNSTGFVHDTWTFTGQQWQLQSPARQPPARSHNHMAHDLRRSRTVLFGGLGQGARLSDTWEWDGTNWSQTLPATAPAPRGNGTMAYDPIRGQSLLFSGDQDFLVHGDLWRWDGMVWSRLAPAQAPAARHSHAATFDSRRGRLLVFGGVGNNSSVSDLWEWDGNAWSEIQTVPAPPGRAAGAMVFDGQRGRAVLFGGDLQGSSNDLWEWDGATWVQPPTPIAPPARTNHAMVYDSARGRCVLFGGVSALGGGTFADTWEWDGVAWNARTTAVRPPARAEHAMAFDATRQRTVVYGGYSPPFNLHTDTWEWDGATWVQRGSAGAPGMRRDAGMTFDAARSRVVMFAGVNSLVSDTWEWDGTSWLPRTPGATPPARIRHTLDYDPVAERVLLFGGQSSGPNFPDVWEYGPLVAATFEPFGAGCAGSAGVPTLRAAAGSRPWLGDAFTLQLQPLAPGSVALLWLGASRAAWGAFALPLDLGFLQMPGCVLGAAIDHELAILPAPSGSATVTIQLPLNPVLLGWTVHCQGAATDPAANAFGMVVSNAATLVLGSR